MLKEEHQTKYLWHFETDCLGTEYQMKSRDLLYELVPSGKEVHNLEFSSQLLA